jgi:putative FmdB family regulatory protein
MPLFEYKCAYCDKTQERLELKVRTDTPTCDCGGPTIKLISSCTNFNLKGKGWHKGDFNGENNV